jgi:hypothetical protein
VEWEGPAVGRRPRLTGKEERGVATGAKGWGEAKEGWGRGEVLDPSPDFKDCGSLDSA